MRPKRRKVRRCLTSLAPFTVFRIRLPRHCASTRERWFEVHQSSFRSASEAHLPSPFRRSRTFALAGARSVGRCLTPRSPGGEPLVQDLAAASARLTPLRACRGRTSPVSVPCGTQLSWRPSRDFPVLAAVFRTALRSRPTAPLIAARVPLREATACFYPAIRPGPLLHRSPGFAPGPALSTGAMGLASAPSVGCLPPGLRWLNETISPNLP